MWLSEHPAFKDLLRAAADYNGMRLELVEKDYWVTRVLRSVCDDAALAGCVIFKGGTSLSKGFKLIDRFSEDVDLLLTGPAFGALPADKEVEKTLRRVFTTVCSGTGLICPRKDVPSGQAPDWYVRRKYNSVFRLLLPGCSVSSSLSMDVVKVEPGFRGGPNPHTLRNISSLAAEFLVGQPSGIRQTFEACQDIEPFPMELLAPSRTFVEKLFAAHKSAVDGEIQVRHLYDLTRLRHDPGVIAALENGTIAKLISDVIQISQKFYHLQIDEVSFDLRTSPAFKPTPEQRQQFRRRYEADKDYYYKGQPPFDEIMREIDAIRETLPQPKELRR